MVVIVFSNRRFVQMMALVPVDRAARRRPPSLEAPVGE